MLEVATVADEFGLNWLLITVVPEIDFLSDIYAANNVALERVEQSQKDSEDSIRTSILTNVLISVGWMAVSFALAWLAARALGRPLSELSKNIKALSRLEFGEKDAIHPSSIREVILCGPSPDLPPGRLMTLK